PAPAPPATAPCPQPPPPAQTQEPERPNGVLLGVADVDGFIGHDGQIPGYNSFVGYDPERRATVVVLVNLNQSPDGTAPADQLTKFLIAKLFPATRPTPGGSADASATEPRSQR
ncbi:serine hydrolase, partial [Streptomyces xanthochromogenes]|uniref:serine hydrolase n=1 Tax=Streptomyces xanthochromogenes TaxID=67384 RepID=UPI00378CA7A1